MTSGWGRTLRAELADRIVVAALDADRLPATAARQTGDPVGVPVADGYGRFGGFHVDCNLPMGPA